MGFFSWVRRVLEPAPWREADGGRPLPGLLGSPDRHLPEQHLQSCDVPSPLTQDRLTSWFADLEYTYFIDSDGDLGGLWRGRLFYFFLFGERQEILQVRGQWNREISIERLTEVLEICNRWNAERLWPKAYARVRDDGMVHVTCEVATDLEYGVTDDQLDQLLQCGLSSASAFFDSLEDRYPDPAAEAP